MYWLGPTRYLRWGAAALVLTLGLYAEFWPDGTVAHPYASAAISRGEPITDVEWKEVPEGMLPGIEIGAVRATVDIAAGEPILPSHVSTQSAVPPDWWSIPVVMPFAAPAGSAVQLVDAQTGAVTEGIVTAEASDDDPFALEPAALVAVPPEHAAAFAVAAAGRHITVLIAGS